MIAPSTISTSPFRGITLFRKAGGDLRIAQQIAGHADLKTTALYDRSGEDVQRAEIERVQL